MQTIMEKSPGKLDMIVKRVSVPVGLEELMEGLTKEVLLKKPKDLYLFASEYFSRLIILRERSSTRKAYPIRVVQSVTQAKTPLKSTRHLSRQINVRGKESMMQKEEPKRVVAPSKVSTPKEKKASSNESTPRENKRAPSSIRGQQLKPKGKTREKLSVPGRKVDEVVATSDKKAVRHLKKSDTEVRKVRTVEAATSEIDNLTGTAAIKVKKTNLPKNGDNIIDDSPKKSENFGSGDSKMAPNDRKYMSIIGKAVSSFENDSIAVETVEDDAKIKIDSANVSQEENVLKPLGDVDSLKERKDDNLTNDPLCQERKEIEKGLAAGKPEVDKTTLKSSEDTEVVIEVNTPVVGLVLEKAHSLERNEDNTNHEICNHGDSLTKTEHADVSEGTVRGTENVVKAVSNKALESGKVLNTEAAAKIEKTIVTNADEIIENKTIDTIADKRDEESFKEISVNDSIEKDNEGKINNQVEQVFSEVITTEGMGTKVEKQNKIENNADCPDGDIEAFTIPKHDRKLSSKKSTKSSDKEENGSSSEDIRDSTNIEKIRNKVEDVDPAETLLSEVTKSKIKISKNVEDSTNQIKIVNESVDEDDEEIQKRKNSKEPMYKTTENNYSNNQDDKPNEKILEPPKNIKIDHPTTSSNTDEQSSSTDTEDKLVSIEMQQLGSSDDMLIIRISDRPTPDTAVPETTENENSEAKLQFFRKSEELVQKENGKIRQLLDVEHLHKLIGTSATSGRIDTTTKEFLHSFLSNEQHYSSKDQESSRKIPSDAMVRKVVETASLGLKEFEPINLHEKKIISGMVPDAILATSISEATTLVSEKSDGIQLSEKESFVSRGSDGLTVKTSDVTPQSQKVKFENLPTHGRSVVRTASEAANEDLEQLEALEITETEVTTKCASDVLAGTSEATATSLIQLEDSHITGKANASDVKASKSAITISDLVKTDAVESGPATSTSAQHKPLNSTVEVQQANSQAQKGALELVIAGSKISAVESQKLTPLAETSNNTQFTTTTQQPSEATSDAFKQLVIPPVIDSDTSIIKDSEVTHLVSNHVNSSESKHVFTVQSEESQLKPCDVSDVTEQKTSASLNNLSSSVLKSEQPHSSQTLKDASEVEIIASELSTVKIIEKILNVASDISEQPEKHDAHISVPDISTVKNSEVSNSIAKYDQELTVSSLGGQHLESDEGQKITDNTYDVTEQKVSESTVPALNQRTALNSFAASESAHTRALIHSFLLSEQQYSSQSQNGPVDLVTVSTIESEKRKLLTQGETSNKDASETINDIITFKQPSSSANSDATRTEVPKSQENKLINLLDQSTNYPIEDLNQELQSNEARKTCSKISDDIPEKSSELASAASKQEDLPTFKSVKDLLDYDNLYFTKDDYTESSSGTKSLQLIIVDEDRSEENGAAKIKRSTTIEDVEEMASFAEDSVVVQQRGLVGQETLRGFSMESSGDKMETSTSSSSGGSYGVVKSDISTQSVSESRILVEDMTRDGEAIKEINEQLIVGGIVNKEANAGDVVNIFVEADMVTLATANEGDHVKDEEMKIDSSTNIGKDLVIDGKNVVGAIVAQHDNSAVRCSLNGGQVENNVGLETRTIETIIKSNIDTIDKTLEDVIAEDWVKDKAIKETFNDNTESHENLVADVVRNDELTVTSPINGEQVKSNEVFESEVTETVTEANVDIVNKTNEDTDVRHPVKVEAIKEIPRTSIESVESLVAEPIAVQNVDLAVTDSLNYCQIENKGVEFGTTATTSEGNVDAIDKINESIVVKDQVKDETIKNIPSKSIESSERLVADAFTVQNSDLIATSPLNRDQVENKEDFNFRITETVTKVHVDEIGKTLEDMVTVEPMKDEAVKKPFNKTKSVEKLVEDATVVRNDALNVTGPLNGDEVKNNQSFKFGTIETVSETNVYVVDKTYEDVAAKDALKDETIKENSNSNTEANERLAADAAVVQNDCLAFTSAPNCNQVENKKSFETGITKTISKSNVGEVDKTLEGMVTVDPVKDEAVNETINNSTELIEKLITDAVEHRTKEFSEEVISNNGTHKGVEEKYLKELQAFNKENTFVKDPEPKRRPKIGEIEQVASVIEVVKTTPMVTKRETSPKKPRKSRLAFKERSLSHSNVLNRERSKSSSSERGESKVRRTQSVGILKSQEMETKSRIPTTDSKRSAGRRPLVRQLETNSKELAEKLNFKRSSDGESGEGDERDKGNSGDSKLMVKADENVKEVDKEKGGISTGERSITINENHIAREAEGTKDQNPDYDKSVVKIDEVVKEVNDVKAENVKFLEKVDDFHGNNTKGNEINSADVRSSIDVKEIAKSLKD
ncbi:uro-adherence factor A-like [Euwallacea similis]|uniref:uro-adherence factor A-like n=1 Tax=Euwallacea similis TaxID=1736056 RepID=UPI00344B5189